ncbi:MAG: hypothetical protein NXI31_14810 [bacterium]|nr:hypothetical protein [bacterium]
MTRRTPAARFTALLLLLALVAGPAPAQDSTIFGELQYRCIGPTRGGRATAVCGVAQRPGEFYMGATGGGVWKTANYGHTWRNVSDGFFSSPSIGAIRVAATNPDLVWVGTGSDGLRSNVIPGRGIYKSTDAGKTWEFMGLEQVGQIGAVEIDPTNPDIVHVAAIGNAFVPNAERGVYRTKDGGKNWEQVFRISETCGAVDLELHPANPETIYASMWEAERKPWTIKSGGTQGGVWRSLDGGDSWQPLKSGGLPTGIVGKSDLAVSRAMPDRLWVLIEAAEKPGLYRSDDSGDTFEFVSNQRGLLLRPFYYCNIDCDPSDADHLFVAATGYQESRDGGKKWRRRFTPHGDNHEVWIHPDNPQLMVQCNDGGANVTIDGGATWSTQHNQPTAELYQVAVDDRFPYWVYAGQQDNSTIRVPSNLPGPSTGGATAFWESVGGCETGPVVPKPGNPNIVYANCKGRFGVYDHRTGQEQQYYVGAANMYGHNPKDLKYRFQRVAPITVSPHDPDVVYHGSQFLHRTVDGGKNWARISPDLTAFEADKQVISGSPITRDITGEEFYSTLYEIAESPRRRGVIWTGANDGPIHVTENGGTRWTNVTPNMPPGGRVQTIEPSWHAVGTAYACVLRYQLGDSSPHVYKTTDLGKTWRRISSGLPANCPVRVVREDPQDPNVLFLGSEWGMFVSLDAGESWQPFQQNLPVTPITDIVVHRDDLVLSTMGRSFWVLDDISAVRELRRADRAEVALLAPRQAIRSRMRGGSSARVPSYGGTAARLHYWLPEDVTGLRLEFFALGGAEPQLVRTMRARKSSNRAGSRPTRDQRMRGPFTRGGRSRGVQSTAGLHRVSWDYRSDLGSGRGPMVLPGEYEVRLVHDGGTVKQHLRVLLDPRVAAAGVTVEDLRAQSDTIRRVRATRDRADAVVKRIRSLMKEPTDEVMHSRLDEMLAMFVDARGMQYPQPMVVAQLRYLASMIDRADQRPGRDAYERLSELEATITKCEQDLDALQVNR